ncbi:unnamed protein product [Nippostrongylus brasiliensis]|uniref:Protein kinase domain-containing protein n=1 Tax=Nippostrongylus brasiliensis TaxID=27835 RepID=A0A0N4YBW5_NIPBR|nr:unnamed protein product [Nippostrongylus brasiliensis]
MPCPRYGLPSLYWQFQRLEKLPEGIRRIMGQGYFLEAKFLTLWMRLHIDSFGMPTENDVLAMNASKSKWKEVKTRFSDKPSVGNFTKMFYVSKDCPAEAIAILNQMFLYPPYHRLHGQQLLNHQFFREIFDKDARRPCGRPIRCLSIADLETVMTGDISMTGSIQ